MGKLKNTTIPLLWVALIGSVILNAYLYALKPQESSSITMETYVDTIPYYLPVPKDSLVVRYVTAKLPATGNKDAENIPQNGNIAMENIRSADLANPDSAEVTLPITQKRYEDSTYTAWVSGYRASLDSFYVYPRREVLTITLQQKPKRWSFGIQAGYGMTPRGLQPYIGVGGTFRIY